MNNIKSIGNRNTEDDFWNKVQFPEDIGQCFIWMGNPSPRGYGMFCMNYKNTTAHRWSAIFTYGKINENLVGDHLCENKLCVNPMHIEFVPQVINNRRGGCVSAKNYNKTHCDHGHEFTEENTYHHSWNGVKKRACKKCRQLTRLVKENV